MSAEITDNRGKVLTVKDMAIEYFPDSYLAKAQAQSTGAQEWVIQ
jgi:hypothetical protein